MTCLSRYGFVGRKRIYFRLGFCNSEAYVLAALIAMTILLSLGEKSGDNRIRYSLVLTCLGLGLICGDLIAIVVIAKSVVVGIKAILRIASVEEYLLASLVIANVIVVGVYVLRARRVQQARQAHP